MINKSIDGVFEDKLNERMEAYRHIASVKLAKDKADMFSDVRNILLNTRLTD